jgi:hypothetical protein
LSVAILIAVSAMVYDGTTLSITVILLFLFIALGPLLGP